MFIQFETVNEATPGEKWQRCFNRAWPFYRAWFLGEGQGARTDLRRSRALLAQHMPELVETYDCVCDLAGNGDMTSRFLSMVDPPPYLAGCSQLAWAQGEPSLVRNYDFKPKLFEGVMMRTEWLRPVIGVSECTWGLLDGMNADGLAACLAFGGRQTVGKGFGVPLVVRYILETCATVPEACERLTSLPVHMAYSITLLDTARQYATVHLSPDRKPIIMAEATCTNHQLGPEWIEHASFSRSVERKEFLDTLLNDPLQDRAALIRQFLRSPLHCDQYQGSFGTLYTIAYHPSGGDVEVFWPSQHIRIGFDEFEERIISVNLSQSGGRKLTA